MTKTYRFIGMVLVAVLICICFAACGGDDDSEDEESTKNNLSTAANKFIGYWHITGTGPMQYIDGVAFFPDGKCFATKPTVSDWSITEEDTEPSSWTYNDKTGVLATSIIMEYRYRGVVEVVSFQWQITLSDDNNWAGVTLGDGYACSAQRGTKGLYTEAAVFTYTWVSEKDGTSFNYKGKRGKFSTNVDNDSTYQWGGSTLHNPTSSDFYLTNRNGVKYTKSYE